MNWIRKLPSRVFSVGNRKSRAISLSTGYKMVSKSEADYTNYSKKHHKKHHCEDCAMFRPPGTCTLVKGDISMIGTCRFWEIGKRLPTAD